MHARSLHVKMCVCVRVCDYLCVCICVCMCVCARVRVCVRVLNVYLRNIQVPLQMYESLKAEHDALMVHHRLTAEQNEHLRVSVL